MIDYNTLFLHTIVISNESILIRNVVFRSITDIEKFKTQRILLDESIKKEETERLKIVHEIDALQIKLDAKDEKVNQLRDHRAELNVVLETTEEHLRKVCFVHFYCLTNVNTIDVHLIFSVI